MSRWFKSAALLLTLSPPGSVPEVWQPLYTQSFITCQIFINFSFVSVSGRHAFSFSITTSCIGIPVLMHQCRTSSAVLIGNGSCVVSCTIASSPSFTTNPPLTEYYVSENCRPSSVVTKNDNAFG